MKDPCDDRVENDGNKDGHPAKEEKDIHAHSECDDGAAKEGRFDKMSVSDKNG